MSRIDDLKRLIEIENRQLQILKEQKAKFGLHTPPHVLTEIEDRLAEIEKLHEELKMLIEQEKATPSTLPSNDFSQSSEVSSFPRPLSVFLCHSSGDKSTVRDIYHRLRANGCDPWLDEEKLLPGQEWELEIPRAVKSSDVVIVCLSHGSVTKTGYINKEIKYALDVAEEQPERTIFLIPLKLEDCQVPERLRRWQWVNYFEDRGHQKLIRALRVRATDLGLYQPNYTTQKPTQSRSCWTDAPDSEIAVRFTPKAYPVKLNRVRFYISPSGKPWTPFAVRIYDEDKTDEPGSRLIKDDILGEGKVGNEWVELDISNQNIVIQEGDFFVSMVWKTSPGKEGKNAQFLGAQDNQIIPSRTYYKFGTDAEWIQHHDTNCMMQVIVNDGELLEIP